MWKVMKVETGKENEYLLEGWEPFGVVSAEVEGKVMNTALGVEEVVRREVDFLYLRRFEESVLPRVVKKQVSRPRKRRKKKVEQKGKDTGVK